MEDIGSKIKRLRTERKMSMRDLAKVLDVSQAHISKLESGINQPSLDLLQRMSELFGIHVRDFFDVEETKIGDVTVGYLKSQKDGLTEEDVKKAVEFVKDLKEGKFDLDKLKDINL